MQLLQPRTDIMLQVRTTIEAKLMSPEFLVEIDLVAAII